VTFCSVRKFLVLLFFVVYCIAQTASVVGTVSDSTGAAVPNAEVRLMNEASNFTITATTDNMGTFRFDNVPLGEYEIKVSSAGFVTQTFKGVATQNQSTRLWIVLQVGSVTETVEVTENPPARSLVPTWNAWLEQQGTKPSFTRLETVHTKTECQLMLDLAAFAYAPKDKSVAAHPAGSRLLDWLKHQKADSVTLKVLMIPDPGRLLAGERRVQDFEISLAKIRSYLKGGKHKIPKDPFVVLQQKPRPDFRFGNARFEFRTGDHEGLSYIGLSLWTNGTIPLDEIIVPVCISNAGDTASCDNASLFSAYHSDPLNVGPLALEKDLPVASLHLIEFDSDRSVGVLRLKEWPEGKYVTWPLTNLFASMGDFIEKVLLKIFDKEVSDSALQQTGFELYNLLLPPQDSDTHEAREALQALTSARVNSSGPQTVAPQILVRIAPRHLDDAFFVPLAMVAVPIGEQKRFLGDTFRVQSPLPSQSYRPVRACISRWVMVMPPNEDQSPKELRDARNEFSAWTDACRDADCIGSIPTFANWIGTQVPEKQPTALLILSHYENDSLTFDHREFVSSRAVAKPFEEPSVAIINACGAAGPGADDFVKILNEAGFEAVVATTSSVQPEMAGQYFNLLAQVLEKHKGESDYTISRAHFDAVRLLEDEKPSKKPGEVPYGAKALIYSLLGNGSLQLCPLPRKP